jgi:hypothetical protein
MGNSVVWTQCFMLVRQVLFLLDPFCHPWWREWIPLWYIVGTFVNMTMYKQCKNKNLIKKKQKILEIELKYNDYVKDSVYSPIVWWFRKYHNCLVLSKSFNFSVSSCIKWENGLLLQIKTIVFLWHVIHWWESVFFKNIKININQ